MNIFVLSCCAATAAELHCDKHCVKMILETAQLLYTHLDAIGVRLPAVGDLKPYKPTHRHHPCALWLHGGRAHFYWLLELGLRLCASYTKRYGKVHKTEAHLRHMAKHVRPAQLERTCGSAVWLRRLAARGVAPKLVRACASKVATHKPPKGCRFGVACITDGTVAPERHAASGQIDLIGSYKKFYAFKRAHKFAMTWNRTQTVPRALR